MIASERFGDFESLSGCPVGQLVPHMGYPDEDVASHEMAGIRNTLETAGGQLGQEARLVEAVFGGVVLLGNSIYERLATAPHRLPIQHTQA